jgi:hypothetical protein
MLRDGQTQACPTAGAGFVHFVESLKESTEILSVDTYAGIPNDDLDSILSSHDRDVYCATRLGHLDRVVNEIHQHLLNSFIVNERNCRLGMIGLGQSHALSFSGCLKALESRSNGVLKIVRLAGKLNAARFSAAQLEQLLDQSRQAIHFHVDTGHEITSGVGASEGTFFQRFYHGLDGGDGRPELVRDVRNEISPHHLGASQLSDMLQDDKSGGRGRGLGGQRRADGLN